MNLVSGSLRKIARCEPARRALLARGARALLGIVFVHLVACSPAPPPARHSVAREITFRSATEAGEITAKGVELSRVTRPAFVPTTRRFRSDPVEIPPDGPPAVFWGAFGVWSGLVGNWKDLVGDVRPPPPPDDEIPRFRVRARGPGGERVLVGELPPGKGRRGGDRQGERGTFDQWTDFRVIVPRELGSPVEFEFEVRYPAGEPHTQRVAVWARPRLLSTETRARPNLLFVVFDTLRADRTGLADYGRDTTPFLEQLAARGVTVEQAIASYPTTLTSHWSLFTGKDPVNHGVYNRDGSGLYEGETLAEITRRAGYLNAGFTESGFVHYFFGLGRAFDTYRNGWKKLKIDFGAASSTFKTGLEWIEAHQADRFFAFLHTYHVHSPFAPPQEYAALYADTSYDGRWKKMYGAMGAFIINNDRTAVSPLETTHLDALYDAEIRELDDDFRTFFEQLETLGVLENTLLVITSDHGEDMMEHDWIHHGTTLYDPAIRVPLLLVWPGVLPEGLRLDCQHGSVDVMPTILELLDLRQPDGMDGQSFVDEIQTGACGTPRPAYTELRSSPYESNEGVPIVSMREGGWKLIRHIDTGELELYDLAADPDERTDLASIEAARAAEMNERIVRYLARGDASTAPDRPDQLDPAVEQQLRALGYME